MLSFCPYNFLKNNIFSDLFMIAACKKNVTLSCSVVKRGFRIMAEIFAVRFAVNPVGATIIRFSVII